MPKRSSSNNTVFTIAAYIAFFIVFAGFATLLIYLVTRSTDNTQPPVDNSVPPTFIDTPLPTATNRPSRAPVLHTTRAPTCAPTPLPPAPTPLPTRTSAPTLAPTTAAPTPNVVRSKYIGCNATNCTSITGNTSFNASGAYIDTNGVVIINADGSCCVWNPLIHGSGVLLQNLTVTLHMQTTNDLAIATNDTLLDLNVTLSGGDLAVRACLPAFSFTLNRNTTDEIGFVGLGGFFFSDGINSFIPYNYSPSSANYTALPLSYTSNNNNDATQLFANFFIDGSVRITGINGTRIPTGTYQVKAACIVYNARKNPRLPPLNVRVSQCVSQVVFDTRNRQTILGNYYEYFGLDYYNGTAYIAGMENCYPPTNDSTNREFNRALLISFYKLSGSLTPLIVIGTLDATLHNDSIEVLQQALYTEPRRVGRPDTSQILPGIAVSRLDSNKITVAYSSNLNPIHYGGWQVGYSIDGGVSFDMDSVNIALQVGIPGALLLPYPQLFTNVSYVCKNTTTIKCTPDLTNQTRVQYGLYPTSRGNVRVTVDAFDVFWHVSIYGQGRPGSLHVDLAVSFSLDYGKTWAKAADLTTINSTAYSYDFPIVATGPDGRGGSQFCVAAKVDTNLDELENFGVTQPIDLNCFHTSERGIVDVITRTRIPGTESGDYGGMNIDSDGQIYITFQTRQPYFPDTGPYGTYGYGAYGSNMLRNVPIFVTSCTGSPLVVCQREPTMVARVDIGVYFPQPQPQRSTWSQPNILVDTRHNLYVLYYDTVRNPIPTSEGQLYYFSNVYEATRILMIKSADGGLTWSAPQSINDDALPQDPFSTQNVHFNLASKYDPITNTILATWIDTRVDPTDHIYTQIYATVIPLA